MTNGRERDWRQLQKDVVGHKNFMHLDRPTQTKIRELCDRPRWTEEDASYMVGMRAQLNQMKPGKRTMFMPAVATDYPEMEHTDGYVDVDTVYLGDE